MKGAIRPVVWSAVVLAAVAVGWYVKEAPSADGGPKPPDTRGVYLFIAGGSDPYWDLCIAGAEASADEIGAVLEVRKPAGEGEAGLEEQLKWLTSIEVDKYDGVAIGPIDPSRQTTAINAVAEKAPVLTVDSDAPASRRMFYIGSSNYEAGAIAARMLEEALPAGGKVVVLMASEAKTNAAQRKQGFEEALTLDADGANRAGRGEYEVVEFLMDFGDFEKCRANVAQACTKHEDLAAVVGTFGYHGPIALEVLEKTAGGDRIKVIAFDEDERTLAGVEEGRVYSTVVQDPFMFGAEAVQMLEKIHSGKFLSLPISGGAVGVHCKAVTKENLAEFREQLSQRLAASDAPVE